MSDPNNPDPETPDQPVAIRASAAPALFVQSGMIVFFVLIGAAIVIVATKQSLDVVLQAIITNQAALLPIGVYLTTHLWRWWVGFKRERLIVWLATWVPNRKAIVVGHELGKAPNATA